ncbi:MAG: hypothetical protein EBU54_17115, partial [Mycobacteriaceae bacterium]|nr:hypothetical protein [Mycobacteriaceae bacterium]
MGRPQPARGPRTGSHRLPLGLCPAHRAEQPQPARRSRGPGDLLLYGEWHRRAEDPDPRRAGVPAPGAQPCAAHRAAQGALLWLAASQR